LIINAKEIIKRDALKKYQNDRCQEEVPKEKEEPILLFFIV